MLQLTLFYALFYFLCVDFSLGRGFIGEVGTIWAEANHCKPWTWNGRSYASAVWSDCDGNTGLDFGTTTWDDYVAFTEEPQKSEVCSKDCKLNSNLRKDKETRIISYGENWKMTIRFRRNEGLYVGHCFLPIFWNLKYGQWDSTPLGRMKILNTKHRTSW